MLTVCFFWSTRVELPYRFWDETYDGWIAVARNSGNNSRAVKKIMYLFIFLNFLLYISARKIPLLLIYKLTGEMCQIQPVLSWNIWQCFAKLVPRHKATIQIQCIVPCTWQQVPPSTLHSYLWNKFLRRYYAQAFRRSAYFSLEKIRANVYCLWH